MKGDWRPAAELWAELGISPLPEGTRRCAQPPYDTLPIERSEIPTGILLSRRADAWIREEQVEDVALPLYEGRMIGQFDFSQKGWVSGKGRTAVWRDIDWSEKVIEPQYPLGQPRLSLPTKARRGPRSHTCELALRPMPNHDFDLPAWRSGRRQRLLLRSEGRSTRIACVVSGVLSSFAFDLVIRQRLGGLNVSEFVMVEAPLPIRTPRRASRPQRTLCQA